MATEIGSYFAGIVALARVKLTQLEVDEDIDPDRAILSIQGRFGSYRVVIKVNSSEATVRLLSLLRRPRCAGI